VTPSLFAQYVKELANQDVIEHEHGFIWYEVSANTCYAREVYVSPTHRKSGLVREMLQVLLTRVKAQGCTKLQGSVVPSNANSTASLQFLLHMGFKLEAASPNFILLSKDI